MTSTSPKPHVGRRLRARARRLNRLATTAAVRGLAYGTGTALGAVAVDALTWWITHH